MPSAASITDDSRFMSLFVGRSGSGKSGAAFSFPGNIKVFDLDGRIRGGLLPWIDRSKINYNSYPIYTQDKKTVMERLNKDFEGLLMQCQSNSCPYDTLVFDSITHETIALLLDAIPLTHANNKGRKLGVLNLAGPEDYKFQSTGTHQVLAFLKSLPIRNIIVTAHIVNKYGRPPGVDNDTIVENVIVGEQLALTDKLAESIPTYFDNVFKFSKSDSGQALRFFYSAQGELARNTLNIPYGEQEITNKNFYNDVLSKYIKKENKNV